MSVEQNSGDMSMSTYAPYPRMIYIFFTSSAVDCDSEPWVSGFKFYHFVPGRKPLLPKVDILFQLGDGSNPGISRLQLCSIVKECDWCTNLCFVDRRHVHCCSGPILYAGEGGQNLIEVFLWEEENAGLCRSDFGRLLRRCELCRRVYTKGARGSHRCPSYM